MCSTHSVRFTSGEDLWECGEVHKIFGNEVFCNCFDRHLLTDNKHEFRIIVKIYFTINVSYMCQEIVRKAIGLFEQELVKFVSFVLKLFGKHVHFQI